MPNKGFRTLLLICAVFFYARSAWSQCDVTASNLNVETDPLVVNGCTGQTTGGAIAVSVQISGGLPPFYFVLEGGNLAEPVSTQALTPNTFGVVAATFTGLSAGTYSVKVRGSDITCTPQLIGNNILLTSSTISPSNITLAFPIVSELSCGLTGQNGYLINDGGLTFQADPNGGVFPYNFYWYYDPNPGDPLPGTPIGEGLLFAGSPFSLNLSGLRPGYYNLILRDANGCEFSAIYQITAPQPLQSVVTTAAAGCVGQTGGVQVIVTGGLSSGKFLRLSGGETFFVGSSNAAGQFVFNIQGLFSGVYGYEVYESVNAGCAINGSFTVAQPSALAVSASVTRATCNGGDDGAIDLSVSGGTPFAPLPGGSPFYRYDWLDLPGGDNPQDRTGLTAGQYTVVVSDGNGCSVERTFSVGEASAIVSTLTANAAVCFNAASGRAIIQLSGGTPPYRLAWSNGTIDNVQANAAGIARDTLFNLVPGNYSVTVTDAAGCAHVRSFVVGQVAESFTISEVIATDVFCNPNQAVGGTERNGTITVYVEGPSQNYTYFASNGLQQFTAVADNPGVFTNLPAGNYTVWVRDVFGCVVYYPFVINIGVPPPLSIAQLNRSNVTCFGQNDGRASVVATGGTPFATGAPYRYVWSSLYDPFYQDFGSSVSGLAPGLYRVTVFDSYGCFTVGPYFEISQPAAPLSVSLQVTDLVCVENSDGRIRALVSGGTLPYTYYWASSDVPFLDLSANSPEISNLPPGNYSVVVVDANNCFVTAAASISNPISFSASVVNVAQTTVCYLDPFVDPFTGETIYPRGNGSITVQLGNANNPPYTFEIEPAPYGFSQSFVQNLGGNRYRINFLSAGQYQVRVRDGLGCLGTTANPLLVTVPSPNGIAGLVGGNNVSVSCPGGSNGSQSYLVPIGGNPTSLYSYFLNNNLVYDQIPAGPVSFNNLTAGTYFLRVLESTTNCEFNTSFVIGQPEVITATATVDTAFCFPSLNQGDITGGIALNVSGGTAPYTYLWSNGATTQNLVNVPAGQYSVTVRDANQCTSVFSFVVPQIPALQVTDAAVSGITCNGFNDASIAISATGGTPNALGQYTYILRRFDGNGNEIFPQLIQANSGVFSGLSAARYRISLIDEKGCTYEHPTEINITEPAPLQIVSTSVTNPTQCNVADGQIRVDVNPALPGPYNFYLHRVIGGVVETSTYVASGQSINPTFFFTGVEGQDNLFGSVQSPNYVVRVTKGSDACVTLSGFLTVTQPERPGINSAALQAGVQNVTCATVANGSISAVGAVQTTAPAGNLQYSWYRLLSNDELPEGQAYRLGITAGSLPGGRYRLIVTNLATGCRTISAPIQVEEPLPLRAEFEQVTNPSCNQNTGAITVRGVGGNPPYNFVWSTTAQTTDALTSSLSNLGPGIYGVTITDSRGCVTTGQVQLIQPPLFGTFVTVDTVACIGTPTGRVNLTLVNGTGPFDVTFSGVAEDGTLFTISQQTLGAINGGAQTSYTDLSSGIYRITVTDVGRGCTEFVPVIVPTRDSLRAVFSSGGQTGTVFAVNCQTGLSASITGLVTGGKPPYVLQWISNAGQTIAGATLPAGQTPSNWTFVIRDANNCTRAYNIQLVNVPLLTTATGVNVQCTGDNNGRINISSTGFNGTLTYQITGNNGFSNTLISATGTAVQTGLAPGIYTVRATDQAGCQSSPVTVTILQATTPLSVGVTGSNPPCRDEATGSANAIVSGGQAPYTFLWAAAPGNPVNGATTPSVQNLAAGTYAVTVTDANGCQRTANILIEQPATVLTVTAQITNSVCQGPNGAINLTVTGGAPPYSFSWSNGSTDEDLFNLLPGVYTGTVTDANGCTRIAELTVGGVPNPAINTSVNPPSCFGSNDGSIAVSISGGTPPFSYLWNTGSTNATVTGLFAGTYEVTVTDANGCTASRTIVLDQPEPIGITSLNVTPSACQEPTGAIFIDVIGGTPPYTYNWTGPEGTYTTQNLVNVPAGSYLGVITDANGCILAATVEVDQDTDLNLSPSVDNISCFGANDARVALNISGGTGEVTISWTGPGGFTSNSEVIENLGPGTYTAVVSDELTCTRVFQFTATNPPPLAVQVVSVVDAEAGASNGSVDISVSGGTPPYTYFWSNGATTQDLVNVPAGTYVGSITDANGCNITATVTIGSLPPLAVNGQVTDAGCGVAQGGSINITVTGGKPPYTFQWSTGATTEDLINLEAGEYTIVVTDANGRTATRTFEVKFQLESIKPLLVADGSTTLCEGGTVLLTARHPNPAQQNQYIGYFWSNGVAIIGTTQGVTIQQAGTYFCTVQTVCGDITSDPVTITVNPRPSRPTIVADTLPNGADRLRVGTPVPGATYRWYRDGAVLTGQNTFQILPDQDGLYTVSVFLNGCESDQSLPYNYKRTTSRLDPVNAGPITIYPNPTNGALSLSADFNNAATARVEVYNGLGQRVANFVCTPENGTVKVSLDGLASGIYTLRLTAGQAVWTGKVVKE
jgi:hypothetical protein